MNNKVTVDMPKEDFDKAVKSGVEQAMKECELTIGMTVKEAVEKQIPKKVMLSKEYPLYKLCFKCHKNLFSFADGWQYNYCPYYGMGCVRLAIRRCDTQQASKTDCHKR